ncbi:glycosyltransferase [Candidatus Woesearchaeota archaeon]|nr:glycosyltransferase [Candidatus Woesearchaeota archaeon]
MKTVNKNQPLVSVIVPTKNSSRFLARCLNSVKSQTYKNIELIIVDNSSTDDTKEIAKRYTKLIFNKGPERSAQFNFGAKKAKGKYLYRIDSDFVLDLNVIEEAVKKCKEGFDGVLIHNTSDPSISFWSKIRKIERDCYRDDDLNVAVRFFPRAVFKALGGFNENFIAGEDYDFHNRFLKKGFKIGRIEPQETHIGEPKSLGEIAKKHYYYGKSIGDFIKENPSKAFKQLSPIRRSYIKHWKKFFPHPMLTLGFFVYQVTRYVSAGIGHLAIKVRRIAK